MVPISVCKDEISLCRLEFSKFGTCTGSVIWNHFGKDCWSACKVRNFVWCLTRSCLSLKEDSVFLRLSKFWVGLSMFWVGLSTLWVGLSPFCVRLSTFCVRLSTLRVGFSKSCV